MPPSGRIPRRTSISICGRPQNTAVIKGLFIFVFHGAGQDFAEYDEMRALATQISCAVVGFDKFYGYPGNAEVPSSVLSNALKELAAVSAHPEVAHAPIFTFGHSNGTAFSAGFASKEPDRIFGWMAFKSAYGAQFSFPSIYRMPGLIISGETDESYFSDQLATVRHLRHEHHALMHMIVEPGVGHGPRKPSSYTILMAFMKTAFQVRVPADADPRQGPVKLIELQESQGWLGQTLDGARVKPALDVKRDWEQPIDVRRMLEIAPYADYPGDKGYASWLPTEEYARKWQQFCMQGNLPQWSEALPPAPPSRWRSASRRRSVWKHPDPPAAAACLRHIRGYILRRSSRRAAARYGLRQALPGARAAQAHVDGRDVASESAALREVSPPTSMN